MEEQHWLDDKLLLLFLLLLLLRSSYYSTEPARTVVINHSRGATTQIIRVWLFLNRPPSLCLIVLKLKYIVEIKVKVNCVQGVSFQ